MIKFCISILNQKREMTRFSNPRFCCANWLRFPKCNYNSTGQIICGVGSVHNWTKCLMQIITCWVQNSIFGMTCMSKLLHAMGQNSFNLKYQGQFLKIEIIKMTMRNCYFIKIMWL